MVKHIPVVNKNNKLQTFFMLYLNKLNYLTRLQKIHGDIYKINLCNSEIVMLHNPNHMKYVLHDNIKNYYNKGDEKGFRVAMAGLLRKGTGMVDNNWQKQRKLIQSFFHPKVISSAIPKVNDMIHQELMLDYNSQKIDTLITDLLIKLTVKLVCDVNVNSYQSNKVARNSRFVMDSMWYMILADILPINFLYAKKYNRASKALYEDVAAIIEASSKQEESLAFKLSNYLNKELLETEILNMIIAGYEPTSSTIVTLIKLLAEFPEIIQRIRKELLEVENLNSYEGLKQLSYMDAVIKESLRLYPPSYWIQRCSSEDDFIDGYHIPKETRVCLLIYSAQTHTDFWKNPYEFNPDRFLTDEVDRFSWLPFGLGHRMCPAQNTTFVMIKLILSYLIKNFNWQITKEPKLQIATNMRFENLEATFSKTI